MLGDWAESLKPLVLQFPVIWGIRLKLVLAVTGASGVIYGVRLASELKRHAAELIIVVSDAAKDVLAAEVPQGLEELSKCGRLLSEHDLGADISSGSTEFDATVICPCSMKTLSAIANGYAYNLICRNADVSIKEQRKVVLVVREMPLNAIQIENMLKLARLGVVILPACPAFYHKPKSIEDLVNHVVGRVLDLLGIKSNLFERWSG
jgi:4-hydroxy-3-polyprenylbenzoate decarboxylase